MPHRCVKSSLGGFLLGGRPVVLTPWESFLNRSATGPVSLCQEDARATRPQTMALKKADPTVGLPLLNPHAAGIDVGSAEHWAAVPPGCDPEPARSGGSFTAGRQRLADWLTACGVNTVALESTGIYFALSSALIGRVEVPPALRGGALYPKAAIIRRWPEKAEGREKPKRAQRRKSDTAKVNLKPRFAILRRAGCPP
jgi:hypothetical protein